MHGETATLLERVQARLGREKGNLRSIALEAGVPYSTLAKLSSGCVTDPRFSTVQRLHDYFEQHAEPPGPTATTH